jgi:hypothetical protein
LLDNDGYCNLLSNSNPLLLIPFLLVPNPIAQQEPKEMKHFVLLSSLIIASIISYAQVTYTTAASGLYNADATWVANQRPPTAGNCNCRIVVQTGHTLTLNVSMTINNVALILNGANSILTFSPGVKVTFGGTSSIDIQSTQAMITRGNPANQITLGGELIYDGNLSTFNSTTPGTVVGLASASSLRASPQFQSGTLPVVLTDFKVSENGSSVAISWKTATELNSSHFVVERSTDGKDWAAIGTIQAAGNVSVEQNYSFTDAAPADGVNYYRLRIVDIDNSFILSLIKTASFKATDLVMVTGPNPATSYLNINVSTPGNQPYRIRLVNRSGQVVYDQKQAASTKRLQLNVSNYAEGTYFVEVSNTAGLRKINQVMVVRR